MKKQPRILTKMINKIAEQLFNFLKGCDAMNININDMLKDTDDYQLFWENAHKSYKDYTGGIDNE